MKVTTLSIALAVLSASNMVEAAPAPQVLTVWETATQVVNTDGSIYNQDASQTVAAASTTAAATAAATTGTSTSATSSSGSTLDSLLSGGSSKMKQWFSKLFGSSSLTLSTTTSSTASSAASSGTSTSTKSSDSFGSFLESLFGGSSSGSSSSSSSTPSTSSNSGSSSGSSSNSGSGSGSGSGLGSGSGSGSGSSSSSTYTPSTMSTVGTTASSSGSSSTSTAGIYDEIYESSGIDKSFAKAILDAHNTDRAKHLAGALSWDKDAYDYAQKVADNYDCSGVLTHTHGEFGENLACGYKDGPSAVEAWYVEGETYDYSTANEYNHFTQLVWKSTTKVGCAYKDCSSNNWGLYIVCEYDPAGNVIGKNKANVFEN